MKHYSLTEIWNKINKPAGPLEKELIDAVQQRDAWRVGQLIKQGANVFVGGEKALFIAAENGDLEIVRLLVEAGSDGTMYYGAPAAKAQKKGHKQVADFLRNHS